MKRVWHIIVLIAVGGGLLCCNPKRKASSYSIGKCPNDSTYATDSLEDRDSMAYLQLEEKEKRRFMIHERPVNLSRLRRTDAHQLIVESDAEADMRRVKGKSPFVRLPEYRASTHPFLRIAENYFNGYTVAHRVWQHVDNWILVQSDCDEDITADKKHRGDRNTIADIQSVEVDVLHDKHLCTLAQAYKEACMQLVETEPEQRDSFMEEMLNKQIEAFDKALNRKIKPYDNEQLSDTMAAVVHLITDDVEMNYMHLMVGDVDERTDGVLRALNECKDFDEQCALLILWMKKDREYVGCQDECILEGAKQLMESGRYSPMLYRVWVMWRSLYQFVNCGMSRWSDMPNEVYNDLRKKCFLSCQRRIKECPADRVAVGTAIMLVIEDDLTRCSNTLFGNSATIDFIRYFE